MTALTRLDRFDDLFNEFFRRMPRGSALAELPDDIRVDLSENDKEYLVTAEIPGARKDDIRVSVDGNRVSISAEIRKEVEDQHAGQGGRSLLKETYRGSIQRTFTLEHDVDDAAAAAKLENGVLRLTLPKRARPGTRLLSIQ